MKNNIRRTLLECFLLVLLIQCVALTQTNFLAPTKGPNGGRVYLLAQLPNSDMLAQPDAPALYQWKEAEAKWKSTLTGDRLSAIYVDSTIILRALSGYCVTTALSKSIDSGKTWHDMDTGLGSCSKVYSILSRSRFSKYVIGTTTGVYAWNDTLWKSIGLSDKWVTALAQDSLGYLLAATFSTFSTTYDAIYKQNPQGGWDSVNYIDNGHVIKVSSFTTNPLYHTFYCDYFGGIHRSNDGGLTWTAINLNPPPPYPLICYGPYVYTTMYDSILGLMAGSSAGIFHSTDDGDSWLQLGGSSPLGVHSLYRDESNRLWAGTEAGIYRTSDNGTNWQLMNQGIIAFHTHTLVCDSSGVTAINEFSVQHSTDKGESWNLSLNTEGLFWTSLFPEQHGKFWGSNCLGIYYSIDHASSWNPVATTPNDAWVLVGTLNGQPWVGGTNGILYRSTDYGSNWIKSDSGLYNTSGSSIAGVISVSDGPLFAFSKSANGISFDSIYTSSDDGNHWTKMGAMPQIVMNKLVANQRGDLFALGLFDTSLYRSTDAGVTWTSLGATQGIPNPRQIAISNQNDICVYADGVFKLSTDNGDTWLSLGYSTIPYSSDVSTMSFDPEGYLFVGTTPKDPGQGLEGAGVFRSVNSVVTSVNLEDGSLPTVFNLFQNFPNPFNPTTTLRFNLPEAGDVTLKIYNILGEEIATLVNENISAGTHVVNWNGISIPSGVYFYRLQAGKFSDTKKLLLLK